MRMIPFQVRLPDAINRDVKVAAAMQGISKHEWIVRAVKEKLNQERNAEAV